MTNATHFEQSIGISSRFGWSHPGPLNYSLMLPMYLATGSGAQSLFAASLLINMMCLLGIVFVIERLCDAAISAGAAVIVAAFIALQLGPRASFDVLIPYSTIMPWILSVFLVCLIAAEGFRWLPTLVVALCFLTQAHVSLWLPGAFLGVAGITAGLIGSTRSRSDVFWTAGALALGIILWLPPILQYDNLLRIFTHFLNSSGMSSPHSFLEAFNALAIIYGKIFSGAAILADIDPNDRGHLALGYCIIVATFAAIPVALSFGNKTAAVLAIVLSLCTVVFSFSLTRFTGPILPHSILFMTASVPCSAILLIILTRTLSVWWGVVAATMAVVLVSVTWPEFSRAITIAETPNAQVAALTPALREVLAAQSSPVLGVPRDPAIWPVALGAIAQVYRDGHRFSVEPFWSVVFGRKLPESEAVNVTFGLKADGGIEVLAVPTR